MRQLVVLEEVGLKHIAQDTNEVTNIWQTFSSCRWFTWLVICDSLSQWSRLDALTCENANQHFRRVDDSMGSPFPSTWDKGGSSLSLGEIGLVADHAYLCFKVRNEYQKNVDVINWTGHPKDLRTRQIICVCTWVHNCMLDLDPFYIPKGSYTRVVKVISFCSHKCLSTHDSQQCTCVIELHKVVRVMRSDDKSKWLEQDVT